MNKSGTNLATAAGNASAKLPRGISRKAAVPRKRVQIPARQYRINVADGPANVSIKLAPPRPSVKLRKPVRGPGRRKCPTNVTGASAAAGQRTRAASRLPSICNELPYVLDPARVMRDAGFEPDPWQAEFLRSRIRRHLLLTTRQAGKSTTAAALAISQALQYPGSLILVVSPCMRQSLELLRRAREIVGRLEGIPPLVANSNNTMEFANGSRIISLPGEEGNIRGYSRAALIIVDEAARVPDNLYRAVRPMLAVSNGRLICLSTPWGEQGWFYEAWSGGGTEWSRTPITAPECPRISPEFLDEEQRALGPTAFAREYMCQFTRGGYRVFDPDLVRAAFVASVSPLFEDGAI